MKSNVGSDRQSFYFLNYAKALGIIALMLYHSEARPLNAFVILYFLQMFFFISGFTYKDEYSKKPILFLKKRGRSLYLPFVGYCLLFLSLHNLLAQMNIYHPEDVYSRSQMLHNAWRILNLENTEQLSGAMWFLIPLITVSVLFCGLSYLVRKVGGSEQLRFAIVLGLFILGNYLILEHHIYPRYLDLSLATLIFYYLGHLYRRYKDSVPLSLPVAVVCAISIWLSKDYGIIQMDKQDLISPSFLYCGVAGIYFNLYIAQAMERWKEWKLMNYIGQNTMIILALHLLAFKLVHVFLITRGGQSWASLADFPKIPNTGRFWYLYAFVGLAVPLFLKRVVQFITPKRNKLEAERARTSAA